MPCAARITDFHTCPKVNPGPVPHVGGPEISGSPDVITGFLPQGRVGDSLICVPAIDKVKQGSSNVLVNNREAARIGDPTAHGGVIVTGCPTVIIGESSQSFTLRSAAASGTPFCEECEKAKREQEAQLLDKAPEPNEPPADSVVNEGGKKVLAGVMAKLDAVVPPAKRQKLAKLAKVIKPAAEQLLAAGQEGASVADWAVAARQSLGAAYDAKFESFGDVVAHVYERNEKKFGAKLGPSAKWLMSKKGKKARDIIEAAATGNLESELTALGGDLAGDLAGKFTQDPTVKKVVKAAATGNPEAIKGIVIDRIAGDVVPNEKAAKIVAAVAKGDLPGTLGEMSGPVVDQFMADLVPNEQARSLLGPLVDYLKKEVAGAVEAEVSAVLAGGAA
jgi:uncharacterized Zn-binding protein involved in type VI secretion